ncbi:hypothetical protein MtrunA17_Chr3g0100891 [Medicago truncatula]|uniref:Transmembrane protein n=1 Tax=Medicago truncatula TaxID=3880 RepID=A0A396ISB7_MEDTR|nr:hypothetical protein MtrunA17_Chr3g0100891 [Medicago truncatula]
MGFDGHGGEPLVLRTVESVLLSGFPCAPCCVAYVVFIMWFGTRVCC